MTFSEKLRQLREQAELTQEQLAQRSGVNLWTIRGYEQGRREPNWKGAIDLARALGVTVEAFAGCASKDDADQAPSGPALDAGPGSARRRGRKTAGDKAAAGKKPRRKKGKEA
jgi:DNA-binding XRE family transcriptional regulator